MQDEPGPARLPLRLRGMFSQTGDMAPGEAVIIAAEQTGRLDAGVEYARRRRDAPHRLDRLFVRLMGKAFARARPCPAEIGGLPYGRAEPPVAATRVDRAVCPIGNDVVDRPHLAERAA